MSRKRSTTKEDLPEETGIEPYQSKSQASSPEETDALDSETAFALAHDRASELPVEGSAGGPVTEFAMAAPKGDAKEERGIVPHVEQRLAQRHVRKVKTVVHFKESAESNWREVIDVNTVSRNGAALILPRPIPIGRLVSLVMDMPRELRAYDQFGEVYPIAAIVQNCTELMQGDKLLYHVGVAFVGKQLPDSYREDPTLAYCIAGVAENGLWKITEARPGFQVRRHVRYWPDLVVSVTYRDEVLKVTQRAALKTRDVSRGGMALWGSLDIAVGDRIKISSKEHAFFSMATIRNRTDHPRDDSLSLIHVQFENAEFPVERLALPLAQKVEENQPVLDAEEVVAE
ncbi:MAG: PilZ domain-containing protein [Pyrinomonadaceae bacterium]